MAKLLGKEEGFRTKHASGLNANGDVVVCCQQVHILGLLLLFSYVVVDGITTVALSMISQAGIRCCANSHSHFVMVTPYSSHTVATVFPKSTNQTCLSSLLYPLSTLLHMFYPSTWLPSLSFWKRYVHDTLKALP